MFVIIIPHGILSGEFRTNSFRVREFSSQSDRNVCTR